MKRFLNYYLSMTLIASLFVVTSCSEEGDPVIDAPVVTFDGVTGDETTVDVGETVEFDVNVTAPGGFNRLVIYETVGSGTRQTVLDTARASGTAPTTFSVPFSYTPEANVAEETVVFEFWVVGEDEQETTTSFTINVNELEVVAYNAVLLSAPLGATAPETNSPSETFFSTTTGDTYSVDEVNDTDDPVSSWIDFGYFYGASTNATIASPAAYPFPELAGFNAWTVKNATKIKPTDLDISQSEFVEYSDPAEFQTLFESATYATNEGRVNMLEAGDVLVFMTDPTKTGGSKYGLIYVNEIVGTDGENGQIDISVRVAP